MQNRGEVDCSVIIVSWNVWHHLNRCLHSLEQQESVSIEIFVVDNGSSDGTQENILQQFPRVHLLSNQRNLGFARANNLAFQQARGRHVLFLNPDTVLTGQTVAQTVRYLDEHPTVGVLGAKMLNPDGSLQRSVRRFPTLSSQLLILLKLHVFFPRIPALARYYWSDFPYETEADVDQVMGAFFACPAAVLRFVGGWDEGFFLWFEEVDLCWRVREAGWSVRFSPTITCVHYGGGSFEQLLSVEQQAFFVRSMLRYFAKRRAWFSFVLLLFFGIISMFLSLLEHLVKPLVRRYVRTNV